MGLRVADIEIEHQSASRRVGGETVALVGGGTTCQMLVYVHQYPWTVQSFDNLHIIVEVTKVTAV